MNAGLPQSKVPTRCYEGNLYVQQHNLNPDRMAQILEDATKPTISKPSRSSQQNELYQRRVTEIRQMVAEEEKIKKIAAEAMADIVKINKIKKGARKSGQVP